MVKNASAKAGDTGSLPGPGRTHAGEVRLLSLRERGHHNQKLHALQRRGAPARRNWRKPEQRNKDPVQSKNKQLNK